MLILIGIGIGIGIGFKGDDKILITRIEVVYQRGLLALPGLVSVAIGLFGVSYVEWARIVLYLAVTIER